MLCFWAFVGLAFIFAVVGVIWPDYRGVTVPITVSCCYLAVVVVIATFFRHLPHRDPSIGKDQYAQERSEQLRVIQGGKR